MILNFLDFDTIATQIEDDEADTLRFAGLSDLDSGSIIPTATVAAPPIRSGRRGRGKVGQMIVALDYDGALIG